MGILNVCPDCLLNDFCRFVCPDFVWLASIVIEANSKQSHDSELGKHVGYTSDFRIQSGPNST